jgi:hypothetical protein
VSERTATRVAGTLLLLLGVLGLVSGATSHYDELRLAGGSHAQLFGVFRTSILLDLIHLLLGGAALAGARITWTAVASLALWLLGVFAAGGWLSLDTAENWLHFVLAAALLGATAVAGRLPARPAV